MSRYEAPIGSLTMEDVKIYASAEDWEWIKDNEDSIPEILDFAADRIAAYLNYGIIAEAIEDAVKYVRESA